MTALETNWTGNTPSPPHILVMEDEVSVARGLELVLEEEGYNVDLAFTGAGALETFENEEFDLVVADLRLPDRDGLEIIRIVKERRPATEVIVITGYSSVSSAVDAMKIGVADYLAKPFTESEIKAAIGKVLSRCRAAALGGAEPEEIVETRNLIQKREVSRVLERTDRDVAFAANLLEGDSSALDEYELSAEAKAAITSGDLNWLRTHVGELSAEQMRFVTKRLQREAW